MKNRIRRSVIALSASAALMLGGVIAAAPAQAGGNCYGSYLTGTAELKTCQDIVWKAGQLKVSFTPHNGAQLVRWASGWCHNKDTKGWTYATQQATKQHGQKKGQAIGYGADRSWC